MLGEQRFDFRRRTFHVCTMATITGWRVEVDYTSPDTGEVLLHEVYDRMSDSEALTVLEAVLGVAAEAAATSMGLER